MAAPIQDALTSIRQKALVGVEDAEITMVNRVLRRVILNLEQ